MSDTFTNVYSDGVSETSFGQKMELTWRMFITNNNNKNIIFTKLNMGTDPILFGAPPPRYNTLSDPRDRSYMNTFIKGWKHFVNNSLVNLNITVLAWVKLIQRAVGLNY